MSDVVVGRLQTPSDENGVRKDIHILTGIEAVVVDNTKTLKDKLPELEVQISNVEPSFPSIWAEVKSVEIVNE